MIGDIFQPTHLLFVLVVALLVLGPKRLPEVGRALGRGIRDFRHAMNGDEVRDALNLSTDEAPRPPAEPPPQAEAAPHTATALPAEPTAPAATDTQPPAPAAPVEAAAGHGEPASADPAASAEPAEPEPVKQNVA